MADYDSFRNGSVDYPLTAATTNTLLQDADPSLHHALLFLAAVLRLDIGARLLAQAALEGLNLGDAVKQTIHVEPAPFLYANQLSFPTLAIYRKNETYSEKTIAHDQDVSEWEYAYVLPPLTPRQQATLQPILRAAATSIRHACEQGFHPGYNDGQKVWQVAGLMSVRPVGVRYGGYEPISEVGNYYRAIVGSLQVAERSMPNTNFVAFAGVDGVIPSVDPVEDEGAEENAITVAEFDADTTE